MIAMKDESLYYIVDENLQLMEVHMNEIIHLLLQMKHEGK